MNPSEPPASLYDTLLAAATKDLPTVNAAGQSLRRLIDGVTIRPLVTHSDGRGSVLELYDPRWGFHSEPLVYAYAFTIRPGVVKGWSLHQRHEDRYSLVQGEMELVLYDPRPGSPTIGEICRIVLTEKQRCVVNVPIGVWHADHNIGDQDALIVNFPTMQYDYANPDKWRLPIDTPLIPHRFPAGCVGG